MELEYTVSKHYTPHHNYSISLLQYWPTINIAVMQQPLPGLLVHNYMRQYASHKPSDMPDKWFFQRKDRKGNSMKAGAGEARGRKGNGEWENGKQTGIGCTEISRDFFAAHGSVWPPEGPAQGSPTATITAACGHKSPSLEVFRSPWDMVLGNLL